MNSDTVILLAVTAMAVATVVSFNRIVTLRYRFESAFAQVDEQLRQRNELILSIVEKVAAYMQHKPDTLTEVIQARNNALKCCKNASVDPGNSGYIHALASAEQVLCDVLARLNGLLESYPELKANIGIQELQDELTAAQARVAMPRKAFNDAVASYNRLCRQFPAALVARAFCFSEACSLMFLESEIDNNTRSTTGLANREKTVQECSG